MPNFTFRLEMNLVEELNRMGITDAFDELKANFSNLTQEHVFLYAALHQAFIKVGFSIHLSSFYV